MVVISRFILFITLAFTLSAGNASAQGFYEHPLKGKTAPDFILDTLKVKGAKFAELSKGKKTILFFWATWCPHCREQIKALNAQRAQLDKDGVVIAFVDIGEDAATVKRFLQDKKYDFDVFIDGDSLVAETYQVFGVPTLFFIGADGVVRDMQNVFPDDYRAILK